MPRARAIPVDPTLEWWDAKTCAAKVGLRSFRSGYELADRSLTLREAHRTLNHARVELELAAPALVVDGPLQVERPEVVVLDGALLLVVTARTTGR